jgi:OOP family OmpA-OmpF porin
VNLIQEISMNTRHVSVKAAAAALLGVAVTACGPGQDPPVEEASPSCAVHDDVRGVAIVLPVHQGSPTGMPGQLGCLLRSALERGLPVRVVTSEGTPRVAVRVDATPTDINPEAFRDDVTAAEASVVQQVNALTATSDGNDTWAALVLASDELASVGVEGRHALIVSRDSGGSDSGVLRIADPGMTEVEPTDVARFITRNEACGSFDGTTVQMYGVGETVAPHPALSARQRASIAELYIAALERCGARASAVPLPAVGEGPDTERRTEPVQPDEEPSIEVESKEPVVLRQDSLGYLPDRAEFVDRAAAEKVLARMAGQLADHPELRVEIRGRTAQGPTAWPTLRALGKARAELCAEVLVAEGLSRSRITTVGVGYTAQPPVTDPASAAANRVTEFVFRPVS